jgi:FkbM family methyltransferase
VTYSTSGEDLVIAAYFDKIGVTSGRFLDIGAANGITLSNTHLFAQKGWSGVCVDANAQELFNLVTLYWNNPKIEIVQGAIAGGQKFVDFWNSKEANTSTACKAMFDRGKGRVGSRRTVIAGFTVDELLNNMGYDYDFISLDLEGETLSIMRALPMEKLKKVRVICVEILKEWYFGKDETPEAEFWGAANGFTVLLKNDENVILVR